MKTIYFANHAQFEGRYTNLGDWAIFEEMVDSIRPYIDDKQCKVVVASAEPAFTQKNYPVTAFQRGGIKGILNTLKWLWKSDVVVIGGGEIVQDLSSMVYIPYQLMRPFIGKLFGKKLFAYAIGIGEKKEISRLGRMQAKCVLNMFDVITVRDTKSYKVLKEYIEVNKPRIYLTADPALNLQKRDVKEKKGERPYVVLSVRSVYHRTRSILPFSIRKKLNLVPKEYYEAIEVFKTRIANIASEIIETYDVDVKFLNTYTGKSMSAGDDAFSLDVIGKIRLEWKDRVSVIDQKLFPCQIKEILGASKLVLTVPLHPLILGASEGVPVVSFAYASKNKCFMHQIRMEKYMYKVEQIGDEISETQVLQDVAEIMDNYDEIREKIRHRVAELKKTEKKNMKLLLELTGI